MLLPRSLEAVNTTVSMGADITKANTVWVGALELLKHAILLDAARDDDGRGNEKHTIGKVDLLGWLSTLELIDPKRVTIDTAKGKKALVSGR
jgi:hypothetical protein